MIDLIGYLSYTIPVIAEIIDALWGPLSGILIFILFRKRWKVALGGAVGGVIEEISVGFDFIPTAILVWTIVYIIDKDKTLMLFLEKEAAEEELINNYRREITHK